MMEDWTEIIGDELENIEEPLPADDWNVLQQKYTASRRRKKVTFFAWAGGIMSVAAAVALVLLLFRPDSSSVIPGPGVGLNDLVADEQSPVEEAVPADTLSADVPVEIPETLITEKERRIPDDLVAQKQPEAQDHDVIADEVEVIDVVRDTVSIAEKLLADAGDVEPEDPESEESWSEEPKRRRRKISIGVSGSASASPILKMYDVNVEPPHGDQNGPKDTVGVETPGPVSAMMRGRSSFTETYRHEIPKSYGISARFYIADRLTLNTGLNYTRYASRRTRVFSDHSYQNDRQYVHYLGIPVRLDWMIVDRKHFNFYMGAGVQADKCIYATVGNERLHEKEVLFGLNGAMGIQVNIVPMAGLYFEPDISYSLNDGALKTYRSREPFVVSVRGGLRFSF